MNKLYKTLGLIILFHPPQNVRENILSYLGDLDKLILWNNSLFEPIFSKEENIYKEKIIEMGNGNNVGLGIALNEAVKYAIKFHFTYLLTMDQDSFFIENDFSKYLDTINNYSVRGEKSIFSPNYIIHNKEWYIRNESLFEVEASMTSGSLYPTCIFNELGLFREDFFIDSIDIEFCLRAKKYGILTKIVTTVNLNHKAGYQKKKHKFLWKTFYPNEYSPLRSYYIIRNSLVTKNLYPDAKLWSGFFYYWLYKRLFFVLMYEKCKFLKIKGLIMGFIHGKKGITGKQNIFFNEYK